MNGPMTILIVEDGDEYLENLSRHVPEHRYLQAHDGVAALALLRTERVDLVYLDMRFDRTPAAALVGDFAQALRDCNGDERRARRQLENHQGLYILRELAEAGFGVVPVILAYDFSREAQRFARLVERYPLLQWAPDNVTPAMIRELLAASRTDREQRAP